MNRASHVLFYPLSALGERRIRVHTMAIPITTKLSEVYANADPQAIATLLAKMGSFWPLLVQ